jgi:hypothetical protein
MNSLIMIIIIIIIIITTTTISLRQLGVATQYWITADNVLEVTR